MQTLPVSASTSSPTQLAVLRWLVAAFPSWIEHRRPDHRRMFFAMLWRVVAEEASE